MTDRADPGEAEGAPTDAAMPSYGDESPFSASQHRPLLARGIPVSEQLPAYSPQTARRDGIAALTVAALALPSAMAYAEVAGVSPVHGLYALLLRSAVGTCLRAQQAQPA